MSLIDSQNATLSLFSMLDSWSDKSVPEVVLVVGEEIVMLCFFVYFGNMFFEKLKLWQKDAEDCHTESRITESSDSQRNRTHDTVSKTARRSDEGTRSRRQSYDLNRLEEQMRNNDNADGAPIGLYSALIKASVQQDKISRAEYWFDRMEQAGIVPDPNLYTTIISGFAHLKQLSKAEEWLNRLRANGAKYGCTYVAAYYRWKQGLCGRPGESDEVGPYSISFTVAFNSVINAAAQVGDVDKAQSWCSEMKATGLVPDVFTYTSIINAAAIAKRPKDAEWWFDQIREAGLQPSLASYNSVMKAWVRFGEPCNAVRWFDKLREDEVEPSEITYSILVNAFSHNMSASSVQRTEECIEEMISCGMKPTTKIFSRVIYSCAQVKDADKAEFWFKRMVELGVQPDHQAYNAMMNALAQSGKWKDAEAWLNKMKIEGFEPDSVSYTQLMNACAQANNAVRAEYWFYEMQNRPENPLMADKFAYNTLIKAHGRAKNVDKTVYWFRRMKTEANIDPCEVSYSSVICAAARGGAPKTAEIFLCEMLSLGMRPDCFNYASLIQAFIGANLSLSAEKWLQELVRNCPHQSSGRQPSNFRKNDQSMESAKQSASCGPQNLARLCSNVIKALAKDHPSKAHQWALIHIDSYGTLSYDTIRVLVEVMAATHMHVEASQWLDAAFQTKNATTALCNTVMASCAEMCDSYHSVDTILKHMKYHGVEWDQETERIVDKVKATTSENASTRDSDNSSFRASSITQSDRILSYGDEHYQAFNRGSRSGSTSHTDAVKQGMHLSTYLESLATKGVRPTESIFDEFILYAADDMPKSTTEKVKTAEEYMLLMLDVVGEPKENIAYHALIRACVKAKDAQKADDWLTRMCKMKHRVSVLLHNSVIDCWANVGNAASVTKAIYWLEQLEQYVGKNMPKPDCYSYNGVIKACALAKAGEQAEYWFKRMQAKLVPDSVSFNGVLNAWSRLPNGEKVEQWMRKMADYGVTPDTISYQLAIRSAVNAHCPEKALCWLEEMETSGHCAPTIVHYNSVLDAYARVKSIVKAEEWLLNMEHHSNGKIIPNTQTYNLLLKACANVKDIQRADSWFNYLTKHNISKDYWTYKQYSFCYFNCGQLRRSKAILRDFSSIDAHSTVVER